MVNIILADDHKIIRKSLKALLSAEPDFNIIGEADNGLTAVDLVKKLQPDILVLDLMMPGMNGLDVIRELCKHKPEIAIIILSVHNNEAYVIEALRLGARGYVLKEASPEELANAIREVIAGHCYLSPVISMENIEAFIERTEFTALDNIIPKSER
jgi:two-component system, NarL family, response regulator NreC